LRLLSSLLVVAQPLLAIVTTDLFLASTLVASRPRFFRRCRSTLVALAVAFFLIVAFYTSVMAATVATIAIVMIIVIVVSTI
jgi:hypothetical protein